jgi:hypothetical protein
LPKEFTGSPRDPATVSTEDLAQFHERIHFNARPVQRGPRCWGDAYLIGNHITTPEDAYKYSMALPV